MPNFASWNHSGAAGCWSTEAQEGVYVAGAAWARAAPRALVTTAAAATPVALARNCRLFNTDDLHRLHDWRSKSVPQAAGCLVSGAGGEHGQWWACVSAVGQGGDPRIGASDVTHELRACDPPVSTGVKG